MGSRRRRIADCAALAVLIGRNQTLQNRQRESGSFSRSGLRLPRYVETGDPVELHAFGWSSRQPKGDALWPAP